MDARAYDHAYPIDAGELATELSQVVTRLRRALQRSARASLDGEALSPTEIELLLLVGERPGIGVAAAATELGAAPNTVSTLIRKLVDQELLRREFDRGDRRMARLTLTDHADARVAHWRMQRAEALTESFDRLEPGEVRRLHDAVTAMEALSSALYRPRRRGRQAGTAEPAGPCERHDPHDRHGFERVILMDVPPAATSATNGGGGLAAWPADGTLEPARSWEPVTVSDANRA